MKKLRFLVLFFVFLAIGSLEVHAQSFTFAYHFREGNQYRILSTVNHDIFVNRRWSFRSEIVNRIAVEVAYVNEDGARLRATFQSAERTVPVGVGGRMEATEGRLFEWARDYQTEFAQDRFGRMTVAPYLFKPMVRNVPVFPDRQLQVGDFWSAPGVIVYDFRDSLGIEEPFKLPLHALYTYLGEREWRGRMFHAFSVSYRVSVNPDPVSGRVFPRRMQVSSDKTVFWDMDMGQVAAYEEHFRIIIELSNGDVWEYRGRAEAEVIEAVPMDREELLAEIIAGIQNIPDATARIVDEGIVISLEDIQFAPDSAVLLPGEINKLSAIAEILNRHPDRDILVTGHTALAGTPAGRLQLSLDRAGVVADYFLRRGVRTNDRVVIRGYGADRPIADNATEKGMRRNRRVEIIILEN